MQHRRGSGCHNQQLLCFGKPGVRYVNLVFTNGHSKELKLALIAGTSCLGVAGIHRTERHLNARDRTMGGIMDNALNGAKYSRQRRQSTNNESKTIPMHDISLVFKAPLTLLNRDRQEAADQK